MKSGKKVWVIAEGNIPGSSTGPRPEFINHETACILNAGKKDAKIKVFIYFSDKEPIEPYNVTVPKERTLHLRFNNLRDPKIPIVVQHSRLDSRRAENALLTTIAYSE